MLMKIKFKKVQLKSPDARIRATIQIKYICLAIVFEILLHDG